MIAFQSPARNDRPLTLLPIIDKLSAIFSRSGLHVWYACTTSNMRTDLAEAHSIRYTTCWQSCGNDSGACNELYKRSTQSLAQPSMGLVAQRAQVGCYGVRDTVNVCPT